MELQLRDYQVDAVTALEEAIANQENPILQQPCRTGKSRVLEHLIKYSPINQCCTSLIIVPSEELVSNLARYFDPSILCVLSPTTPFKKASIYITTGSYIQRHLHVFDMFKIKIDRLYFDEVHHIGCSTWLKIFNHFSSAIKIGFSATPTRLDGKGFETDGKGNKIFTSLISSKPVRWFIDNQYLSPFTICTTPNVLKSFHKKNGEYDLIEQADYYDRPTMIGNIVREYKKWSDGDQAIFYGCSVEHSMHVCKCFNESGIAARHIDGKTSKSDRRKYFEEFKTGKIKVLCNFAIFIEGIDVPDCTTVIVGRLTASLSLYIQFVMRGMTYQPEKVCKIIDMVGVLELHGTPDLDHSWTLYGVEKANEYNLICSSCDDLIYEDYRPLSKNLYQGGDDSDQYVICPSCGSFIKVPRLGKRKSSERDRSYDHKDGDLVLLDLDGIRLKVASLVATAKKNDRKPYSVVYRMLELPGLNITHWEYLCELNNWEAWKAKQPHLIYSVIWNKRFWEYEMFQSYLISIKVPTGMIAGFWKIYEAIDTRLSATVRL